MSTLPASPAVPAAPESAPAVAPKKAMVRPSTQAPAAKPAAKATLTNPAPKATAIAKPLAKAFAPAETAVQPAQATKQPAQAKKPAKPQPEAATASAAKPAKPPKVKKPKLVRERFTTTEDDMAVLRAVKQRAGKLDMPVKKGTVLRAGIRALTAMSDTALVALLKQMAPIK